MSKYETIRGNIPPLFRPERGDGSVVTALIRSVGALMDDLGRQMGIVMQAHWAGYADDARFDPYLCLDRLLRELPPLTLTVEEDRLAWETFPHVCDLARIGALLALPPYRDPVQLRESVEAYRTRLGRYMRLYRNGLGTVAAIRSVVEMELPADPALPAAQRERSFCIEEFAATASSPHAFESRKAKPDQVADEVGPLMRWSFCNDGMETVPVTLYIQGITPVAGQTEPTLNPTVEYYQGRAGDLPLAVAYRGLLAPGQTLRMRPAFASWLGTDSGLLRAEALPDQEIPADPTAPGPWSSAPEAPAGRVTALLQTYDRVLWAAVIQGAENQLWRLDGTGWRRVIETFPLQAVHCLAERDHHLCVGTDAGLLMIDLYPAGEDPFTAVAHGDWAGLAIYCLFQDRQGGWWVGTGNGAFHLHPDNHASAVAALSDTAIRAIHQDRAGVFYFGGDLGLFQYQPSADRWAWYHGEQETDQARDWEVFAPGALPRPEDVFLPPVHSVYVGQDSSVWIGTSLGFARYYAQRVSGATYKTLLEAYPDLAMGQVYDIREDARGLIWFLTQRGLFRYDGRDLAQYQAAQNRWVCMGRADLLYDGPTATKRDAWRYNRSGAPSWQRFDRYLNQWRAYIAAEPDTPEAGVRCLAWTDSLTAELGTFTGEAGGFAPGADGHPGLEQFVVRVKPSEDRIVAGGMPAVPRLPRGKSTWRYLSLEPEEMAISPNRPWWSREGRLFSETKMSAPFPARHNVLFPTASSNWFGEVVFAYKPAARLWLEWAPRVLRSVLVRLEKRGDTETIAPAILDRVWQGIQRVRPAGVRVMLAVAGEIVRGEET